MAPADAGDGPRGCGRAPNCVSSRARDARHRVAPLRCAGPAQRSWAVLREVLRGAPRTTVVEATATRLRAEVRSRVFGFVDDVEFVLQAAEGRIEVRSAARSGWWDLGVNRRRVARIRARLERRGVLAAEPRRAAAR